MVKSRAGERGEEGLATWVVAHAQPQLVDDELLDLRVRQFQATGPVEGSLICVPLRGPEGPLGVVSMERLGSEERFDEDDFESAYRELEGRYYAGEGWRRAGEVLLPS